MVGDGAGRYRDIGAKRCHAHLFCSKEEKKRGYGMREDGMEGMKKKKGRGKERRMAEDWTREEEK